MIIRKNQREKIIQFIKKNPKTTYREIRKKLKLHPERIFKGGLKEAFDEAGVKHPRTFERRTKEEKKKIIIEYIRKHPEVGGHTIRKDTKIDFLTLFKNTRKAFEAAGIDYPRKIDKRAREEKEKEIIRLVKENP
jgi:predicted transcriptional regulator